MGWFGSILGYNRNHISSVLKIENRNRRFGLGFGFGLKNPGLIIFSSVSITKPTNIRMKNNTRTGQIDARNLDIIINITLKFLVNNMKLALE